MTEIPYEQLTTADFVVDAVYKGGTSGKIGDEPLHLLLPKCGTSGGFRKVARKDDPSKMAYVVLYTTMSELEWPDFLDSETGIFRYYGDNRSPGKALTNTKVGGNKLLEEVFSILNSKCSKKDIPPFLIFRNTGNGRDMQFLGLAAPGNRNLSPDRDLVAFWRSMGDKRFQNYEAYFTILDTGSKPISRVWLEKLIYNHENSIDYAPEVWKAFINNGRDGIKPLKAPKIFKTPTKYEQLQCDNEGKQCLNIIRNYYAGFPQGFEACATDLVMKMDTNFVEFNLTRPWRDGGRDAIGRYAIRQVGNANYPLLIDCALEAKCYAEKNSVGVRQMSRLISRIRYRQFGIMVTTSFVDRQAYEEVIEDGHPILIVSASDIASILRRSSIHVSDMQEWLDSIGTIRKSEYDFEKQDFYLVADGISNYET